MGSTLYNCTVTGNTGGGADDSTLYNCTVMRNAGDGAWGSTLYNCAVTGNAGSGAASSTLYNCTVTDNAGGGVIDFSWNRRWASSAVYYSIVYYNAGGNYDTNPVMHFCCTSPLPTNGVGNIALDPQLASASHLSADSPCRGAGNTAYATGQDIDGEPWGNPPSIGCDEYHAGAVTGPLTLSLVPGSTIVTPGFTLAFTAFIEGRTTASVWDFGDGVVVSNRPWASHAWAAPGDYAVVLRAYNDSLPGGVSATGVVRVAVRPVLYVAAGSLNPLPPYLSWATAATNIQQAVDATGPGAEIVVANGVYGGGLVVANPLALRSVNGPKVTVINGGGTNRCVSLTDGASLTGFTLTNGYATYGGGVWCHPPTPFSPTV